MGRLNDLESLLPDREELIMRLADMAETVRSTRSAGAAMPLRCLLDCDTHHWTAWGPADVCTNCGTRPLPADQWHRLLTLALRRYTNRGSYPAPSKEAA